MKCPACNSEALRAKIGFHKNEFGQRVMYYRCENCDGGGLGMTSYRDAAGNAIAYPSGGFKNNFSDSVGEAVTSKRHYADIMKRDGLAQGNDSFRSKKSMGEIRRPVRV